MMEQFTLIFNSTLYISSEEQNDSALYYLLLSEVKGDPPKSISFDDSWNKYIGVYVFMPAIVSKDNIEKFTAEISTLFKKEKLTHTSISWIEFDEKSAKLTESKTIKIALEEEGGPTFLEERFHLFILKTAMPLAEKSNVLAGKDKKGLMNGVTIEYPLDMEGAPVPIPSRNVNIPITGASRGCLNFEMALNETSQDDHVPHRGFYYFITTPSKPEDYLQQYYPMFNLGNEGEEADVFAGYKMNYDPLAPYNPSRTALTYLGFAYTIIRIDDPPYRQIKQISGAEFQQLSYFSTVFGDELKLSPVAKGKNPAGYVLCELPGEDFYMAPRGDFQIVNESKEEISFACGLTGTEFFKIPPQSKEITSIRFQDNQPACVLKFPFDLASPVGSPSDPSESLFSDKYKTSWATIVTKKETSTSYVSQPKGAALYGKSNEFAIKTGLIGHVANAFNFLWNGKNFFPIVPYSGLLESTSPIAMPEADMQKLEQIVLSKERTVMVSSQTPPKKALAKLKSSTDTTHTATTPAGLFVKTTQNSLGSLLSWDQYLLAKNGSYELAFNDPTDQVISAMQSSNIFMVACNNTYLTGFASTMGIADWELDAKIGQNQKYGDYSNVMIFKGRKGKLYDPDNITNCLIANPKKWNQTQDFSIPQTGGNKDESQLVILSNWLQEYFKNAHEQESDYFQKFNTIATDENWTGILFLRVDIKSLPSNVSGMVAGVTNPSAFNAHHLGVEISPVELTKDGTPDLSKPSSMFGLIYYVDPQFSDTVPVKSIAPSSSGVYDFRLLSLKVLFDNTAVKSFESYAQLTLTQLFDSTVSKTLLKDNIYHNVLLVGSLQMTNGQPVYSLSSKEDDAFYLNSNIINKVEITDVYLSSRSKETDTQQTSWFGISGFIDYKILEDENFPHYDLFSFGNEAGQDESRKGLNFFNLGIEMDYPLSNPQERTMKFVADEISFNTSPAVSTAREGSLFLQLALSLEGLIVGRKDQTPKDKGYLDMISDIRLGGPGQSSWYGLRFKLNLGTPGALAANAGFNGYLLMSWSALSKDAGNYQAGLGISLPGTSGNGKLLSIQSVLKLSINQILLRQIPTGNEDQKAFMVMFTDIALKFLSLLKIPPGGNTLFYLFGDSNATGDARTLGWYAMYKKDDSEKEQEAGLKKIKAPQ